MSISPGPGNKTPMSPLSRNTAGSQMRSPSQSQIQSQHYGFGNLPVSALGIDTIKNKSTGLEASGKFQEKLLLKQRQKEELLMENRLKKLQNDSERFDRQIAIANKHSEFADTVMSRRHSDYVHRNKHMAGVEAHRNHQNHLNGALKLEMEQNIKIHEKQIHQQHLESRAEVKGHTKDHNKIVEVFRKSDLSNKQTNTSNRYQNRRNSNNKQKYDRETYLASIQRANQQVRKEHVIQRTMHEQKLNQLNELEERLIGDLQNTMRAKQEAITTLQSKSPALKKSMEARKAYKYETKEALSPQNGSSNTKTMSQKLDELKQMQQR